MTTYSPTLTEDERDLMLSIIGLHIVSGGGARSQALQAKLEAVQPDGDLFDLYGTPAENAAYYVLTAPLSGIRAFLRCSDGAARRALMDEEGGAELIFNSERYGLTGIWRVVRKGAPAPTGYKVKQVEAVA